MAALAHLPAEWRSAAIVKQLSTGKKGSLYSWLYRQSAMQQGPEPTTQGRRLSQQGFPGQTSWKLSDDTPTGGIATCTAPNASLC